MNLIFPETRVIGLHFFAADQLMPDSMGLFSFNFVQWAPKDASILQQCWLKTDFDVN